MKKEAVQERSKQTVQIILEAALQVLIEHGYEKAATNRIAERSGFGVGTLYQYFEDKDDIYHELVERELNRMVSITETVEIKPTLAESLNAIIKETSRIFRENPGTARAVEPLLAGRFKDNRARARQRAGDAMANVLQRHREEITVDDLGVAAHLVVALAEGFVTCASPEHFTPVAIEEEILALVLAALTTH